MVKILVKFGHSDNLRIFGHPKLRNTLIIQRFHRNDIAMLAFFNRKIKKTPELLCFYQKEKKEFVIFPTRIYNMLNQKTIFKLNKETS